MEPTLPGNQAYASIQCNGAQELYCIAWENTARAGRGKGKKAMPRHQAQELSEELNDAYPTIKHWIERV